MPPRRSARVAALAQQLCLFTALPLPLTQRILMLLLVDVRARACCVCRAWRDALQDPLCWMDLDLARLERPLRGIVQQPYLTLAAAAAKARCQLRTLRVPDVSRRALVDVLTANAGSLRKLRLLRLVVDGIFGASERSPSLEAVMAAAPLLQAVEAEIVACEGPVAPALMRAVPPFSQLTVHKLYVHFQWNEGTPLAGMERVGPFVAALADAALQSALSHVCFQGVNTAAPVLMDAIADAVLARRLPSLALIDGTPPAAASLARLLRGNALKTLLFSRYVVHPPPVLPPVFDVPGAALVATALRANTTLTELSFHNSGLCLDAVVAQTVLGALVGHPSLRKLTLMCEAGPAPAERGAALAAIVAANAPALESLMVSCISADACTCHLGDAGLTPLVAALRRNQHLRRLDISCNEMSERFARRQLLPAVRANTSLRKFVCYGVTSGAEAMNLVERRAL